jgi:hypothetical protein
MFLWFYTSFFFFKIKYILDHFQSFETLYVKAPQKQKIFVCSWAPLDVQSAYTYRNDIEVATKFLGFCVAVKYFTRSDGINRL